MPSPRRVAGKTGIGNKVFFDNGAEIFMVCDMFRKNDKRDGSKQKRHLSDARTGKSGRRFLQECEFGDIQKAGKPDGGEIINQCLIIYDLQILYSCSIAYNREQGSDNIACAYADNKRNQF